MSTPRVGGVLVLVALLSVIVDALLGISPGRRLTPERASQNVVASAPAEDEADEDEESDDGTRVRLIITANYDAGRLGLVYRDLPRRVATRLRGWPVDSSRAGWAGWRSPWPGSR